MTSSSLKNTLDWVCRPLIANTLAVLGGLSFLLLCMILPLVGPAGAAVPFAGKNFATFLAVLLVTLAFSGLAAYGKVQLHKRDGSPFPRWTASLTGLLVLLLLALLTGLLKI